jgi:hypothetical protein
MQGFNPVAGFDRGRMPGQAAPQNAGFNPRDGRDLGPTPPVIQRPATTVPAVMPGQWPTAVPTCNYQPVIAAPPPAAPAQTSFYYGAKQPQAAIAPTPTQFSFPTPAAIAAALSGTLVTTQPAPRPDNLPLKPSPGTLPSPVSQITWPPAPTTTTTGTTTTTSTALTFPSANPSVSLPRDHLIIRILLAPNQPWNITSRSDPIPFYELWVPETLTIRAFLQVLGRPAPIERTIIYEVSAAGNGKWYKGLEVHGYMPGVLDKTLKSVGWDSSRDGRVGERGHREELSLWFGSL